MKIKLTYLALISIATLVTGCSSLQTGEVYMKDKQKIYQIEKAARESPKFIHVIWVNPPTKKVEQN